MHIENKPGVAKNISKYLGNDALFRETLNSLIFLRQSKVIEKRKFYDFKEALILFAL